MTTAGEVGTRLEAAAVSPGAVELAALVSPAPRIEPELLRAVRLHAAPQLDAGAEGDLWFGPLVSSRGAAAVTLDARVAAVLRDRLAVRWRSGGPARHRLERARSAMARVHENASPALVLEERLAWLAIADAPQQALEEEIWRAVRALADPEREGLVRWAEQAWPRLPEAARQTRAGWVLGETISLRRALSTESAAADIDALVRKLPVARLGVAWTPSALRLGAVDDDGAMEITVPDLDPQRLQLTWMRGGAASHAAEVRLRRGQVRALDALESDGVRITTASGDVYEIVRPAPPPQRPARVFYSYAHEDEALRNRLEGSLVALRQAGLIEEWHDRQIVAGRSWGDEIHEALDRADIILLLLSSDFLASSYVQDVEVERALARHRAGTAVVVPILLRPVPLDHTRFRDLQVLPTDARPVTSWANLDEALVDVVNGLVEIIRARTPPPPVQRRTGEDEPAVRIGLDEVALRVDDTEFRGRPNFSADTLARLADLRHGDPDDYGRALFDAVFDSDPRVAEGYGRARALVRSRARFRLRLHIDLTADALQALAWEALVDPGPPPRRLAIQAGTPLSRFVDGADLEPVRGALVKLLVVVSDPAGLHEAGLGDYDAAAELALVEDVLRRLDDRVDYVVHGEPATPFLVRDRLLDQKVDVLHLVAPVVGGDGAPGRLLLEAGAGEGADAVSGEILGALVDGLTSLRLVVLSTGWTSSGSASDAHLDIAARLLEYGVPAVVAVPGSMARESVEVFTTAFYDTLLHSPSSNGLVDAAANHAREAVWFRRRDAWDWAAPVVFLAGEGWIYDAEPDVGRPAIAPVETPLQRGGSAAQRRLEAYHLLTVKYRLTASELAGLAWALNVPLDDPAPDLDASARQLVSACAEAGTLDDLVQLITLIAARRGGGPREDPALEALRALDFP